MNEKSENVSTETDNNFQSIQSSDANSLNLEAFEIPEKGPKKSKFLVHGGLYNFMLIFGVIFMISLYVFQIYLTPIKVVGQSMQPTVNASVLSDYDEDHCDVVYYHAHKTYNNDDIVIVSNINDDYIESTASRNIDYLIKRVVACPSQSITFYVTDINAYYYSYDIIVKDSNGTEIQIDRSYLDEDMKFSLSEYEDICNNHSNKKEYKMYKTIFEPLRQSTNNDYKSVTISLHENEYFVMGDNRNHSEDSRYFGLVHPDTICGKMELHVEYGSSIWNAVFKKLKVLFS